MIAHHPMYPYKERLPAPLYWVYRAIRTALVAACFAGFWSGSVVAAWLVLPITWVWPGTRAARTRRSLQAVRFGFNVFHASMHFFRLYHRTSPAKKLRPGDEPVIYIANHPTLCDVTSIVSMFPNIVAIARPTFARNPLINRALRMCGFVPTGIHVLKECEERLRAGFDVLVFPEGTRSPLHGPVRPFHRGAFELAARANVKLVLLKLTCEPAALSKRLPIWKVADNMAVLTVEPFATIDPKASGLDSRALCRQIEQRYREVLGYPDERLREAT